MLQMRKLRLRKVDLTKVTQQDKESSFIWCQCECLFLWVHWLSKSRLRSAVSAPVGNFLDTWTLSPPQTHWVRDSRSGTQASVFQRARQMILMHTQVWEPLPYAMHSLFNEDPTPYSVFNTKQGRKSLVQNTSFHWLLSNDESSILNKPPLAPFQPKMHIVRKSRN